MVAWHPKNNSPHPSLLTDQRGQSELAPTWEPAPLQQGLQWLVHGSSVLKLLRVLFLQARAHWVEGHTHGCQHKVSEHFLGRWAIPLT